MTSLRAVSTLLLSLLLPAPTHAQTRADLTQQRAKANPKADWWDIVDTGPFLSDTFLGFGPKGEVAVLKGIAIKSDGPRETAVRSA